MPTRPRRPIQGLISRIENGAVVGGLTFHFNPTTIKRSRSVKWDFQYSPGGIGSNAEFVRVDDEMLDIVIFLAYHRSRKQNFEELYNSRTFGVLPELAEIESWSLPSIDQFLEDDTQYIQPPKLLFVYGDRTWECVLKSYSVTEELHDSNLNPLVARVSLSLQTTNGSFDGIRKQVASLAGYRDKYRNAQEGL